MLKKYSLLLVCLYLMLMASGQQEPDLNKLSGTAEKLKAWTSWCNSLFGSKSGQNPDYALLATAARQGLSLCPPDSLKQLSQFSGYAGVGFRMLGRYDSAVYYLERSVTYARQARNLKFEVRSMNELNTAYYFAGKAAMREDIIRRVFEIYDSTADLDIKHYLTATIAEYYSGRSQYDSVIHYKLADIDLMKERLKKDPATFYANIGVSYISIASIYHTMGRDDKAMEYLHYSASNLNNYRTGLAENYNLCVEIYLFRKQPDSARHYYQLIQQLHTTGESMDRYASSGSRFFAHYYLSNGQIDSAVTYAKNALSYANATGEEEEIQNSKRTMGEVLFAQKKYGEALAYLEGIAKDGNRFSKESHLSLLHQLSVSYGAMQQWDKAYLYSEQYSQLNDTLLTAVASKNLAESEARYQNKEKQQQIENKNLQLSSARKQALWLIAGLVLLAVAAILLIIIYRNKKRAAQLLDEKNKTLASLNDDLEEANRSKAKLFGIISHDLRSPINQVYQFLKLQQLNPHLLNDQQKNELSSKIQAATGSLLETMEDLLLWSKTQMSSFNTSPQITALLPILKACQGLLHLNSESKNIRYTSNIEDTETVYTDPYYLQTIIRNLLQNAIKASPQNGEITLQVRREATATILSIHNEGVSFSQEDYKEMISSEENAKTLNGLGLMLVDELSERMGASVKFVGNIETGTEVEITLPADQRSAVH